MLEALAAVDWSCLTHAYGKATDVPGVLRSLLSADQKVRREATSMLYSTIWHQGTVYSATAAAVPFLYELLTAPDVRDKSEIAHLLTKIAVGSGHLAVHAVGSGEQTWREIFAEEGKTLEGELEREASEVQAVHRAVSVGLRHLLPYLQDGGTEMRRCVAVALGKYPEHQGWSLPAIEAALESETHERVREALAESKAQLSTRFA